MANTLKPCLNDLISDQQSAFIEGRLLTDNALITFEINHFIKRKTQGLNGVAGFKIDVSKAYDRLKWRFIEQMMHKFGFHQLWVDRVMVCIRTVSYSFLHNGEVFGEVKPQRGIRQGEPISPYLYILCAEGLVLSLGATRRATHGEATLMNNILKKYERFSGQMINFNKSSIVFSPNTCEEDRRRICEVLQVHEADKPGKYLGMPMQLGKSKTEVFGFLSDRVEHKLQGWSNQELSKEGKLTLLKSAAQTMPSFWMSLFQIPVSLCESMERKMNAFSWGKGSSGKGIKWIAWEKLCMPKTQGGLGFHSLQTFNTAMLAKQGWRILTEVNPLVITILKAKYFPDDDFLNAQVGSNPSYVWRSIMSAHYAVKVGTRRRIGDGLGTRVWSVPWLPDREDGYLTTPVLSQLQDITVKGFMNTDGTNWDMDVDNGLFTVKSCYKWLQGDISNEMVNFWRRLWSLKLPGKLTTGLQQCIQVLPGDTATMVLVRAFAKCSNDQYLLSDWKEAQLNEKCCNNAGLRASRKWSKPQEGWVKVNVNAAIFQDGSIGIRCVIRDSQGQFLYARNRRIVGAWQPREAEAISLREAMTWVKELNFTYCVFETDCKALAEACNGKPGEAYFGTIVLEYVYLLKHINHMLVEFIYRSANNVAHELVKATYS
ncbi:uncharacterized protein LOC141663935 [Apium graveolens]|uniref:uncharacterized protein LOC141663935 n=1 Tax=Apium graveolens TaxID=4045 RepID=UPI003D7AB313